MRHAVIVRSDPSLFSHPTQISLFATAARSVSVVTTDGAHFDFALAAAFRAYRPAGRRCRGSSAA